MRVHDRTVQAQRRHAALELAHRTLRVLRRDHGQTREPVRITANRLGHLVVRIARKSSAGIRIQDLHAGGREHQHLFLNAEPVHVCDASGSDVLQQALNPRVVRESAGHAGDVRLGPRPIAFRARRLRRDDFLGRPRFLACDALIAGIRVDRDRLIRRRRGRLLALHARACSLEGSQ